jgi:PAS domain S-box-containing protein
MSDGVSYSRSARAASRVATFLALLIIPLIVIVTVILLIGQNGRMTQLQADVRTSYETRAQIQRVFSLAQDAETGQRGYVIAGRPEFLQPYTDATRDLNTQMARLEELLAGNGAEEWRLATLRRQVAAKQESMAATIEARDTQGREAALARVAAGHGKALMDAIRVTVAEMQAAEAEVLNTRIERAADQTRWVRRLIASLLAGLVLSLLLASWLTVRVSRQRQRLLRKSKEAAERLDGVLESTMDAVFTLNPSGSIEALNKAAERMFGWPRDELIRRDVSVIADLGGGQGPFLEQLAMDTTSGEGVIREITGRRRDGTTFPGELSLGVMNLTDGAHLVGAVRDITERRQAERIKEEFISTVSHELRTPLTSIAGSLGILETGVVGELSEKAQRMVYIARVSSERLVRLINDLLDIEKLASGGLQFDMQAVDLIAVARRAIDDMDPYAGEHRVSLLLEVGDKPIPVRGDFDRLLQVVTNLISNAVKFSPEGQLVQVRAFRDGGSAKLTVRDHGPGIPESFRATIFGKFAQADSSSSRDKGGTGLGLAISREIVERHGGQITFDSEIGQGATFCMTMPLDGAARLPDDHSDPGARLLVCEDEPHASEIISQMLRQEGFNVDAVATAAAAEEALRSRSYTALILDLRLPDGDGLSLVRKLRETAELRAVPVLVVSASASERRSDPLAGALQVVDWLDKPFDRARLREGVKAVLHSGGPEPTILHVDDDRDLAEVVRDSLGGCGTIIWAPSLKAARQRMKEARPDVVVLDIALPDGSGIDLLVDIGALNPAPAVVIYSAQEIDPSLIARVDAVLTKSRTSMRELTRAVRQLSDPTTGK